MEEEESKQKEKRMQKAQVIKKKGETRMEIEEWGKEESSLGRYVFGSEISYNKAPPRLPGLAY